MSARSVLGFAAILLLGTASEAWSQGPRGTITGVVTDARTGAPVSAAQVHIPQILVGALTQSNGRFLLVNVPPGAHTVRAERIGYGSLSREVTVTAGQTTEANFAMSEDALALDEIVVTGTAGQARRREVGNTISQISVAQVEEPVANLGALLQGRLTGARITEGGGNSGSGADIRLRGNVSMSMSNNPLIYIDGVRAKSEPYPNSGSPSGTGSGGGMDMPSPLNDINPSDIERIEIVKGPAATTLYGTEAAAGVIQIFTKSGGSGGAPVWSVETQQGFSYMRPHFHEEAPYLYAEPILRHGYRGEYGLSVRGGQQDRLGYFVSGSWDDKNGAWYTDYEKGSSLRGNTTFSPSENVQIQFNNSLTRREISNIQGGGTGSSVYFALSRGDLAGYAYGLGARSPEILRQALEQRNITNLDRYVNGLSFSHRLSDWFTQRLTLGHDFSGFELERLFPYCWRCGMGGSSNTADAGAVHATSSRNRLQSLDYVGTVTVDLLENLRSTFSFGVQGVENSEEGVWASGSDLPGPGDYTASSAARREGWQSKLRMITGGFFLQDMVGFANRYFLTVGIRVDGNSAFGSGFGLQPYPKVSMSYVVSDESFWPEMLGRVKLRAAYGLAGRAPGAFDAVRTWEPIGWGTAVAAFKPQNLGNPDLGPEKTSELEAGFDASLWSERLTLDFTYYNRTTSQALFRVTSPSSAGGWRSQLQNVGEINNNGMELGINASILAGASLGWEVGAGITTNNSMVVSLGGAPPFSVGNQGWVIEGHPAPVIKSYRVANYYEAADPIIVADSILGPASPTHIFNANTTVTLPGGISLSARGEYQGGSWMLNQGENGAMSRSVPTPQCYEAYRKVEPGWELGPPGKERGIPNGARPPTLLAWERANCFGQINPSLSTHPADYFELRDVTVNIPISRLVPSITGIADRADLTVSVRNPWGWKHEEMVFGHPESGTVSGAGSQQIPLVKSIAIGGYPIQSYFTVSLRAIF